METDEMIWVDVPLNACRLEEKGKSLLCHYQPKCQGNDFYNLPCGGESRILVSKQEYLTWKLTK